MKNWTKPEVAELEVSMTAGGFIDTCFETEVLFNKKEKRQES